MTYEGEDPRLESLRQQFKQALDDCNWDEAIRLSHAITDIESGKSVEADCGVLIVTEHDVQPIEERKFLGMFGGSPGLGQRREFDRPSEQRSWLCESEEKIEIPFNAAPEWIRRTWRGLWPGTRPTVLVTRTEVASISFPYSDSVVRNICAYDASTREVMANYVPGYESLVSAPAEEKALYFGGQVKLSPGRQIAVMDYEQNHNKIRLYVHPSDYTPPETLSPVLTERQQNILATTRAYVSGFRRNVFEDHGVTQNEIEELRVFGLVDRRGALTILGRNVARDYIAW